MYKKIISSLLGLIIICLNIQFVAKAEITTEFGRTYFDCNFLYPLTDVETGKNRISGWDINDAGGEILKAAYIQMTDRSKKAPVEAERKFDALTHGKAKLEFDFYTGMKNGVLLELRNGYEKAVSLNIENGMLNFDSEGYTTALSSVESGERYLIRLDIDMDNKSCDVYVGYKLAGSDLPFYNIGIPEINNFYVSTGIETTGAFVLASARLYGGYALKEDFAYSKKIIPDDWSYYEGNTLKYGKSTLLECDYNNILLQKGLDSLTENVDIDFQLKFDGKRSSEVSFGNGAVIGSDSESLWYKDISGNKIPFYDYMPNMWYHFKLSVTGDKYTLFLNGKKKAEDIDISGGIINRIRFNFRADQYKIEVADIKISNTPDYTDYVPTPNKVTSGEYSIGMQMCPLWSEGEKFGYDWLCDEPGRKPLLGYYDEGSPEATDWEIKWMAEHGIDFQWHCWYKVGGVSAPICDQNLTPDIHEGFFNAKYSDMMKFAILWENVAESDWTSDKASNRERFLKYVVPFWIEYYFKDNRYYTVNGRPALGIYNYDKLLDVFGTEKEISAMIDSMGDMCTEEGLNKPYIIVSTYSVDYNAQIMKKYKAMNLDCVYSYNLMGWQEYQQQYINTGISLTNNNGLGFIPSFASGYDLFANNGASGKYIRPPEFKKFMLDSKQLLSDLPLNNGKKMVMMASWNEYTEGHYIMPTAKDGFEYLDAIRDVFVGTDSHSDIIPSDSQLYRITTRYPRDRKTEVREANIPDSMPSGYTSMGVKSINKTLTADSSGKLTLLEDTYHPELVGCDYVRLNIDNNSNAYELIMSYITSADASWSDRKRIQYHIDKQTNNLIVDLPVGRYLQSWVGTLLALKFSFAGAAANQKITVKSIELFRKQPQNIQININGVYKDFIGKIKNSQGKIYIDAKSFARYMGASYYYDCEKNKLWMKINNKEVEVFDDGTYSVDDMMEDAVSTLVVSSELYLPVSDLSKLFLCDVAYSSKVINVTPKQEEITTLHKETFDKTAGMFTAKLNVKSATIENGSYHIVHSSGDPMIYTSSLLGQCFYCEDIDSFSFRLKSPKSFSAQLFFTTESNTGITEDKSVRFDVAGDNEYHDYTVKIDNAKWIGKLHSLRFDLANALENEVWIDEFSVLGYIEASNHIVSSSPKNGGTAVDSNLKSIQITLDAAPSNVSDKTVKIAEAEVNSVSASGNDIIISTSNLMKGIEYSVFLDGVVVDGKRIREKISFITRPEDVFDFKLNFGEKSYLSWGGNYKTQEIVDGAWRITPQTGKSVYMLLNNPSYDISNSHDIYICLRSKKSISASVYFTTNTNQTWDENKRVFYNISGGDEFKLYKVPMSANANWKDRLSQLRIDFGSSSGENEIELAYLFISKSLPDEGVKVCGARTYELSDLGEKENVSKLYKNKNIYFECASVSNETNLQKNLSCIIAYYDSGRLIKCEKKDFIIDPYVVVYKPLGNGVRLEQDAENIKIFIWDDMMRSFYSESLEG